MSAKIFSINTLFDIEGPAMGQDSFNSNRSVSGKHNSLFGPGENWQLNACVGKNGGYAEFDRLARGYFLAGEVIVERVVEDRSSLDILIYPLVQNYRQGIENMLKHLVQQLARLQESGEQIRFTHSLTDNWQIVRKHLKDLSFEKGELDNVQHVIKEFVDIDATGATFRYPRSKNNEQHLEETTLINVVNFIKGMDVFISFAERADCYVSAMLEQKREMEQYYRYM